LCVVRRTAAADDDVLGWSRWRNWSGERLSGDWVFEEPVSGTRAEPVIMTLLSWEKTMFVYTTCRAAMRSTDVPRRILLQYTANGVLTNFHVHIYVTLSRFTVNSCISVPKTQ